jgi:hypothetical protein
MTPFFRFVTKRATYWLEIISLAHAPVLQRGGGLHTLDPLSGLCLDSLVALAWRPQTPRRILCIQIIITVASPLTVMGWELDNSIIHFHLCLLRKKKSSKTYIRTHQTSEKRVTWISNKFENAALGWSKTLPWHKSQYFKIIFSKILAVN